MTINARESRLWQKVKKGLNKCFLTRIESSTINGIPDIHAVSDSHVFWIELKSDEANYPKLNKWQIVWINKYVKAGGKVIILDETLSKKLLKLYRPVSGFTDPRSLVSFASFSFPLQWPRIREPILQELVTHGPGTRPTDHLPLPVGAAGNCAGSSCRYLPLVFLPL